MHLRLAALHTKFTAHAQAVDPLLTPVEANTELLQGRQAPFFTILLGLAHTHC
jgi:hypothetical protein